MYRTVQKQCKEDKKKHISFLFLAGLIAVCLMAFPYLILGQDGVVSYHDQLDGEMIAYILQAKNLFSGDILPQFMGGVPKTALTVPAPLSIFLFLTGNYYGALIFMQMLGSLTGYAGMYLLAKKVTGCKIASVVPAVIFAYLPFLPVYGLSQFGIPLLFWFYLEMEEGRKRLGGWIYSVIYALNSSLVLVGFGVLLITALFIIGKGIRCAFSKRKEIAAMGIGWFFMLLSYVLCNRTLIGQVLGISGSYTSHKEEVVLNAQGFLRGVVTAFLEGGQHSLDYHSYILGAAVLLVLFLISKSLMEGRGEKEKYPWDGECRQILLLLACNLMLSVIAGVWNCGLGVRLREIMGAAGSFQLDRLLWMAPVFWYLLLSVCLSGVLKLFREGGNLWRKAVFGGVAAVTLCAALLTGFTVFMKGNSKLNLQKLLNPQYPAISYSDYYALGVMEMVEEYIREQTGLRQEEYRVVSLGIDPAAALYGGFYCLDGYSNNYPLSYKHDFRKIIAPELDKSEYLTAYFDDWGNRCYLLSAEIPGYFNIKKATSYYLNYSLDTGALQEMGGRYLLSAAYIADSEKTGLKLLREEPFQTEDSYYWIYLYEIM